ncbi:hypothetical protein BGX27_004197, partial [Mortierella sp. AM989]
DFAGLNENYDRYFIPRYIGTNILPKAPPKPIQPTSDSNEEEVKVWRSYNEATMDTYNFTVCEGCPQLLNPKSLTKYEDLPACSKTPKDGAQEYGVHTGYNAVTRAEEVETQNYEWVAARPSCRHSPQLVAFQTPEKYQLTLETTPKPVGGPLYGSPPPLPTLSEFNEQRDRVLKCLSRERHLYLAGDSHIRMLLTALVLHLSGDSGLSDPFVGWDSHHKDIDGIHMKQEFDKWAVGLNYRIRHVIGKEQLPGQKQLEPAIYDGLDPYTYDSFDTILLDFGAWAAAGFDIAALWTTDKFIAFISELMWDLAKARHMRQEHYKKTGEGFSDLRIIWLGQVPWPDTRKEPDMRTNSRLRYWEILTNDEIRKVNEYYSNQGGMIDHLNYFNKVMVYRQLSPDAAHHTEKRPVNAL